MGNIKVQFNIRPEVSEMITRAAAKRGITRSQYIQDLVIFRMPYTAIEMAEYCRKIGKSRSTLFKWISEGCDPRSEKSVREWVTRNTIRETNISKARKRRRDDALKAAAKAEVTVQERSEPQSNGDSAAAGRRGAHHARLLSHHLDLLRH